MIPGRLDLHLLMYTRNLLAEWILQTSLPYHRMYFRPVVGFILSNRNANLNCNCFWSVRMYKFYRAGRVQLVVSKLVGPTTKMSWFDSRDGARHFSVSKRVQSGCGVHLAPYSTSTQGSSHGQSGRGVKLNSNLHDWSHTSTLHLPSWRLYRSL